MTKIVISGPNRLRLLRDVRSAVSRKMNRVLNEFEKELIKISEKLSNDVQEFINSRSSDLIGEFGFTPEEVNSKLRQISNVLVANSPSNISMIDTVRNTRQNLRVLRWVDFEKLKESEIGQHELTRYSRQMQRFVTTAVVSWVEWLEEGQIVTGYVFDPSTNETPPSRSGEGIMIPTRGGIWRFEPTLIFQRTGRSLRPIELARRFRIVARRVM